MTKRKFLNTGKWAAEFPPKDRGVSLIETMIAVLIAMIGVFGLGSLIFQATVTNKNQGTEVTRATIYAQDKMEKLLSFGSAGGISTTSANFLTCTQAVSSQPVYCNSSYSCTSTTIPCPSGSILGITDPAWNTGLKAGGVSVSDPTTEVTSCASSGPSAGYVDFLDANGNMLSGSCANVNGSGFAYIRMWQIGNVVSGGFPLVPKLKQVTVGVWSQAALNASGAPKPVVVITSYMSDPN
jgi:Tfp pilus assembly protein PilV